MRLVVTGGGTGGHVYPAAEVALGAKAKGWDVRYFGSLRGQEKAVCERSMISFSGFASEPVYKLYTLRGMKSLANLLRATTKVREALEGLRPDVVFATGGYASAPVMNAARKMGIPVVIHEQNSVPGRTNKIMSAHAKAVCTVFHAAANQFPADKVRRTGLPIRAELRASSQGRLLLDAETGSTAPIVLVMGGSQGSASLNDVALSTAVRMAGANVQWLHLTGEGHFQSTMDSLRKLGVKADYVIKAYLHGEDMASALFNSATAVCRSGAGSMAELAAFRKPSVLVPYPYAFGQHQLYNAQEFAEMGAAEVVEQPDLDPAKLESRILSWLNDSDRMDLAAKALAEWDVPDSVDRILAIIEEARS